MTGIRDKRDALLRTKTSSAIVAVRDIARARLFYAHVLGLEVADEAMEGVIAFKTGATVLIVYQSDTAGSNRANAVVWDCGDQIDAIIGQLAANGVTFEHYPDSEQMHLEGDVHVSGKMKMAWFKDPDGNILHLNSM
ncbi:VOC family protein [Microvirga antarctica]|uniref:VOC family protein n=1 Tax=Microvirga antarctica TaxID=2819233 RepID=UPI0031BADC3F